MTDQPKEQPIHPDTRCCANCLFWEKLGDAGDCRRHAPVQFGMIETRHGTSWSAVTRWTEPLYWCGDFWKSNGYSFSHEIIERALDRDTQIKTLMSQGKTREEAETYYTVNFLWQ